MPPTNSEVSSPSQAADAAPLLLVVAMVRRGRRCLLSFMVVPPSEGGAGHSGEEDCEGAQRSSIVKGHQRK